MLAVLLLIFISYVNPSVIPIHDRENNEVWSDDYNMVEPPSPEKFLSHIFDHSKSKITPQNRLKSVIKALYQYDTMSNFRKNNNNNNNDFENHSTISDIIQIKSNENKSISKNNNEEQILQSSNEEQKENNDNIVSKEIIKITEEEDEEINQNESTSISNENEGINLPETTQSELIPTDQTTQKLGLLLEDLVDSIVRNPPHMEVDKAQKFTHSIRYGYGTPFHYKGL